MALSQTSLRTTLGTIFSVDSRFIVPKQGNWFNPQDMLPTDERPSTWIAFRISRGRPRIIPVLIEDTDGKRSVTFVISKIDLQIVGTNAEALAQSIYHWPRRQDVKTAFEAIDAELILDDYSYTVADFYQDGANNILSYNTSFGVLWESVIEGTASDPVIETNITGTLVIPE